MAALGAQPDPGPRLASHGGAGRAVVDLRCDRRRWRSGWRPARPRRRSSSTDRAPAPCGWRVGPAGCTASSTTPGFAELMHAELESHPNASVRGRRARPEHRPRRTFPQGRSRRPGLRRVRRRDRRGARVLRPRGHRRPRPGGMPGRCRAEAGRRRSHRVRQQSSSTLPGRDHAFWSRRAGVRWADSDPAVSRADLAALPALTSRSVFGPTLVAASATSVRTSSTREARATVTAA